MPFQLVVITPERTLAHEAATAAKLLDRGLQALHVRKPGASAADLQAYLQALPAAARRRCMLHSQHELAKQTAVGGIHLREADRPAGGTIKAPPGLAGERLAVGGVAGPDSRCAGQEAQACRSCGLSRAASLAPTRAQCRPRFTNCPT